MYRCITEVDVPLLEGNHMSNEFPPIHFSKNFSCRFIVFSVRKRSGLKTRKMTELRKLLIKMIGGGIGTFSIFRDFGTF